MSDSFHDSLDAAIARLAPDPAHTCPGSRTCPGCGHCDPQENDMPEPCPHCHGIGLVAVFEGDVPVDERCGACGGDGERSEW